MTPPPKDYGEILASGVAPAEVDTCTRPYVPPSKANGGPRPNAAKASGTASPAGLRDEVATRRVSCVEALLLGPQLAEELPPLDYIVQSLELTAGSGRPHLVAGYGFSGKTLAMQAMLLALAAGRRVWGGYAGRESRVVHVDLEMGRRTTQRRYQRLARAMSVDLAALGDKLALASRPALTLTLAHRSDWLALMQGRDVMLIDSLRAATPGQDENSSEIRSGLDILADLSEITGCRVIVIHHARKPTEDRPGGKFTIRGSSAIYDACDSIYVFSGQKGEPVSVETEKAQEGELPSCALVISDVEVEGNPRAGLRVAVHGAELIQDRRAAAAKAASDAGAKRDAEAIVKALVAHGATTPALTRSDLVSLCKLGNRERYPAAMALLGGRVMAAKVKLGRTWVLEHRLGSGGENAAGS